MRAKVTSGSYAQGAGDLIYIKPLVIGRLYTNPFKSPKREFPVDMGYGSRTRTVVDLVLPEGFEVKESPVDKLARIGMSDAWFTQKTVVDGRHVRVEADLDIERIEYPPAMYQQLKTFYEHMTAWQSEQIVLQRKVTSPARGKK